MKINSTIFFTIASLFYSTLLMIAYFSKDKIKTPENKVYSKLIIFNFIGIILEIFCTIFAGYAKDNLIYYTILNKIFLMSLIGWGATFGVYVFLISTNKENKELKVYMKKVLKLYIAIFIMISLLIVLLPIEFKYKNGYVMYSYGAAANVVYGGIFISIILMLGCLIKNFKNIKSKKYLPIYAYLFMGTVVSFVQKMFPELLLAITMDTFITVMMYFTIENPDKKLLEAIHKSKKTANDANLEKSMLVYNMMSEVKQIATDVNRYSNIILNSTNLEETKFFAREIIAANSRLYTMSNKIYNIDEIEVKKIKTINTKYNIKLVLKEIITIYKKKLQDKNINFRINIDNNIPNSLYGDSINLKEALNILMTKTYKDTEKGFIELSVSSISKYDIARIIIKIEASNNKIINNDLEQDKDISKAREILSAIGGSVITTNNTNGNTITIILDQKINKKELPLEDKYDKYLNNKKILVVDDNEASLKLIEKILTKYNIKVETVSLGKLALDKIRRKEKYDLILVDEEMPYIDGEELMYKLNKIEGFNTKVILLTKNNNVIYDDYYKDKGFSDYILKPIDKRELINKILDNTK